MAEACDGLRASGYAAYRALSKATISTRKSPFISSCGFMLPKSFGVTYCVLEWSSYKHSTLRIEIGVLGINKRNI